MCVLLSIYVSFCSTIFPSVPLYLRLPYTKYFKISLDILLKSHSEKGRAESCLKANIWQGLLLCISMHNFRIWIYITIYECPFLNPTFQMKAFLCPCVTFWGQIMCPCVTFWRQFLCLCVSFFYYFYIRLSPFEDNFLLIGHILKITSVSVCMSIEKNCSKSIYINT